MSDPTNPLDGVPVERAPSSASVVVLPDPDAPVAAGPPCARCGQPTAALSAENAALLAANPGAVVAHDICPDAAAPAAPPGRNFEVRCQVVEIIEQPDQRGETLPRDIELLSFVAGHRAADLDTAMRPLALELGKRWERAEANARIADTPPPAPAPAPEEG